MELHWLARGVIDHDGVVLAMRSTGGRHTFLPGGHVETDIAEDFETALLRELREGLAVDARISHYLGAVAWRWPEPNVTNYEINRIFAVTVAPCAGDLTSREPELECVWLRPHEFAQANLQPLPLRLLLKAYLGGSKRASSRRVAAGKPVRSGGCSSRRAVRGASVVAWYPRDHRSVPPGPVGERAGTGVGSPV